MPSLKSIRKRITSTKATQKITRAMKMVAGARLTRAQQRITQMRPYAIKTGEVLQSVAASMTSAAEQGVSGDDIHPLLAKRPEKKVVFLVLAGDRGLCGAFNTNVNKAATAAWQEKQAAGVEVEFASIGKKAREFLNRRRANLVQDFVGIYDGLDLDKARKVTSWLVLRFERGEIDAIYVVYNEFKTAITQKTNVERLLPLEDKPAAKADGGVAPTEFLYEPNQRALLERLVPMY